MTDPKLREARIAEAKRRTGAVIWEGWGDAFAHHISDLYESDWRPEPEVDAVTLAAREWLKATYPRHAGGIDGGCWHENEAAFRAGHADAMANHPDTKRMDWLGGQWVEVVDVAGRCFRHGIFVREPGPLRAKIDRAMEGGE